MTRNLHSTEFQEQALSKVRQRGPRSVQDVADDLNMAVGTLRKWLTKSNRKAGVGKPVTQLPDDLPAQSWGPARRLLALNQTHAMSQTQLHAWCREKGLFEHQLKAWGEAFCTAPAPEPRESRTALRELQVNHDGLQRELRRGLYLASDSTLYRLLREVGQPRHRRLERVAQRRCKPRAHRARSGLLLGHQLFAHWNQRSR